MTRSMRLAAKASPYHSAVTVYEAASLDTFDSTEAQAGPSTLSTRRSRHVKREPTDPETSGDVLDEPDDDAAFILAAKPKPALGRRKKAKTPVLENVSAADEHDRAKSPKKPTRTRPSSKPSKAIPQALDVPHPAPANWAEAYAAIKDMRARVVAPVDTMGCDQAQLRERDPKVGSTPLVVSVSSFPYPFPFVLFVFLGLLCDV